jgi:aflatoxin B1 aldehyde reductase
MFDALQILRAAIGEHKLTEAGYAPRWAAYHSMLKNKKADAIIISADSLGQLEGNLGNLKGGPLPGFTVDPFN